MSINGIEDFEQSFSRPVTLHECASDMLAGGIAHDMWNTDPFPVYFDRAGELYKCNFQGNQFVQFWLGPEAHLCGHRFESGISVFEERLLLSAIAGAAMLGASSASPALQEKMVGAFAVLCPALLLDDVDCQGSHGRLSSSHPEDVIAESEARFARAFDRVKQDIDGVTATFL